MSEKDAEIERLAKQVKYDELRFNYMKKLIGELADWLENQIEHMGPEYKEAEVLIRRARVVELDI